MDFKLTEHVTNTINVRNIDDDDPGRVLIFKWAKTVKYFLQKWQKTVRLLAFYLVVKHGKHRRQTDSWCVRVVRVLRKAIVRIMTRTS